MRGLVRGGVAACIAAGSLVVASGCGGDDGGDATTEKPPLSGVALSRAADAICVKHAAPDPAKKTTVPFDTVAELKAPYIADQRRARAAYEELKALNVAPAERATFKNLTDTVGAIAAFDAAVGATTSIAGFTDVAPRVVRAYEVALKYATRAHSTECPPVPASPAYLVALKRSGYTPPVNAVTTEEGTGGTAADATSVLGSWRGVVTQYGPGSQRSRYTTQVEVTSTTIGQDGGTSTYPKFNCEGRLTVSQATRDGSAATFREDIVKGRKRCYDVDARIRLERPGGHYVTYRWRGKTTKGTPVEVLGRLGEVGVPG